MPEKVSDETRVGKKTWKHIKSEVCGGDSYKEASWYTELNEHQKTLLKDLKQIQHGLGGSEKEMEPQWNYVRSKFIEERIDYLLPARNFYFHKIFAGDSEEVQRKNLIE